MLARRRRRSRPAAPIAVAVAALLLTAPGLAAAEATEPDAGQIIRKMKAAMEPAKPSMRVLWLTVTHGDETEKIRLAQARKPGPDGQRSLTVVLEPKDARGLAYLVLEGKGGADGVEYLYAPMIRRVRELVRAENYTAFLDTDFTYGDLGLLSLDTKDQLLGTATEGGKKVYRVQSTPGATVKQWYYSRYVTWIDATSLLPIRREFYSPAGDLFKTEKFEQVTDIEGVPTPLSITIQNVGMGSSTTMKVTDIAYGTDLPDEFFTPARLGTIADAVEGRAAKK